MVDFLAEEFGVSVCETTVSNVLKEEKISRKKVVLCLPYVVHFTDDDSCKESLENGTITTTALADIPLIYTYL